MNNIKKISDSYLCSGCGSCNAICGHNAINIKKTNTMGLLHAEVDLTKCTDCGLCIKMCPSSEILKEKENVSTEQIVGNVESCYVGRASDKDVFTNAQSGGMVTAILAYLFDQKLIDAAVSCRMEYASPVPSVHYNILTDKRELNKNQKSCYTQVDIVSALKETSNFKSVAVVGVPCHIQGISRLMSLRKFSNISYRIGLICDKTYAHTYMDAIIHGVKKPKGDILINFRKKNFTYDGIYHSYQQAPTVLINKDNEMTVVPNSKRMFLKDYFAVPKCKICWDKLNTLADIVLGDPWGLKGQYNENEGDSVIIVRTIKGLDLLNRIKEDRLIMVKSINTTEVVEGQLVYRRVRDIRSFDFNAIAREWKFREGKSKKKILFETNKEYKIANLKNHIVRCLQHLRNIVKNR